MELNAAFAAALSTQEHRIGIFMRLEVAPSPLRIWLGVGPCEAGVDAQDGPGQIYTGFGELLTVPAVQQLINGAADRATFQLSAIPERVAKMASLEADQVKGAVVRLGVGVFDGNWTLAGSPVWLRSYVTDYLTISRDSSGRSDPVWTVALQVRSLLTGRRRPGLSFWTDPDQQARSPGDRFCERATLYANQVEKAWPIL